MLIGGNYPLIKRKILLCKLHSCALCRNPKRTKIISCPLVVTPEREEKFWIVRKIRRINIYVIPNLHYRTKFGNALRLPLGERHVLVSWKCRIVEDLLCIYAHTLKHLGIDRISLGVDGVGHLKSLYRISLHSIYKEFSINKIECISRKSNASLYVVILLVYRSYYYRAVELLHILPSVKSYLSVIVVGQHLKTDLAAVGCYPLLKNGISVRKTKDHNITPLHLGKSL